jgi:hypothetical protein
VTDPTSTNEYASDKLSVSDTTNKYNPATNETALVKLSVPKITTEESPATTTEESPIFLTVATATNKTMSNDPVITTEENIIFESTCTNNEEHMSESEDKVVESNKTRKSSKRPPNKKSTSTRKKSDFSYLSPETAQVVAELKAATESESVSNVCNLTNEKSLESISEETAKESHKTNMSRNRPPNSKSFHNNKTVAKNHKFFFVFSFRES